MVAVVTKQQLTSALTRETARANKLAKEMKPLSALVASLEQRAETAEQAAMDADAVRRRVDVMHSDELTMVLDAVKALTVKVDLLQTALQPAKV